MTVDTSLEPYMDDFDEDKGFLRLLFVGGRAVQARELTQLQTILSNQIARFGQNIFTDGSPVVAGEASVDTNYEYVKLTDVQRGDVLAGATVIGNTSGLVATILQIVDPEDSDPLTLYVKYTGGGGSEGGRFQDGETLAWTNTETGSGSFTAGTDATGTGTKIDLQKGIYFTKGVFAAATTQSLIIEKYGIPTGVQEIGLTAIEEIVTSEDDESLLDNASGTNNHTAIGADRLKISLSLIKRDDVDDEDYFTIATLKDEIIVKQADRTVYGVLGDELAKRTYDESGNYTIDPFIVHTKAHETDNSKLTLVIDSGHAYVSGYEVKTSVNKFVDIDRASGFDTKSNGKTSTYFGNYVRVENLVGAPNIASMTLVDLEDSSGTVRGSARVRGVEHETGNYYRLYLFDISMNSGYAFNIVHQIDGTSWTADLIDISNSAVNNNAVLYDVDRNNLVFPMPHSRVKTVQDITVRVQKLSTGTAASGAITLDTNSANHTWESTGDWIVFRNDTGAIVTGSVTYGSTGAQTLQVSGLTNGIEYTVIGYMDKTTATTSARTKTLSVVTDSVITPDGDNKVALGQYDILELVSVKDVSNSDADITSRYTLDNGQRDNFYEQGSLSLKSGFAAPSGDVKVTFKCFLHGSGDYFSVDSYNSFVGEDDYTYGDIPTYTYSNGSQIRLSDAMDFRPKKTTGNVVVSVNELPKHNSTIQADVTYYLPRKDVVWVDKNGNFGVSTGNPSLDPKVGQVPENSMALTVLTLGAGTVSLDDISSSFVENKRYTMRDIGTIETRISRLEETVALTLLETDTASLEVLDNDGLNRFKSGFFVDNFRDHAFSSFEDGEYRASIDPANGIARPSFTETNQRLIYTTTASDGSVSSNVVKKGDILVRSYTEVVEISQGTASSAINVNPYNVVTNIGGITLSPTTDEWRDTVTKTKTNTIQTETTVNPVQVNNWNNWQWNWAGVPEVESTPTIETTTNLFRGRFSALNWDFR